MERKTVSTQTRNNWLLNAGLFTSAIAVTASSLYFLYFPSGGYQGGRNPAYNAVVLFNRSTWDNLHTWAGIAMIVIALVHLAVHSNWVTMIARRVWHAWTGKSEPMNARGRFNVIVNALVAASFLLAALSGVYFLFAGGSHGGANPDPMFLFTRTTWDLIHTWSGVVMLIGTLAHFAIHWRWVVKVTGKIVTGLLPDPAGLKALTAQQVSGE